MMFGEKSRIVKAYKVEMLEKKFRVNPPEGWEEEEAAREAEEEQKKADEKQRLVDLEMTDIAAIRERELATVEILKEQIIGEAQKDSKRMMDQARGESEKYMRDAIQKADEEKQRVHDEAYQAGFEEGAAAGAQEGERLANEAKAVLEDAKKQRQQMIDKLEPEMVELISAMAEKLLYEKAAFNPKLILNLVRAGLAESRDTAASDEIQVMVSEDDFATVSENKEELLKVTGGGIKLEIIKDPSLNKSDCIIKTAYGYIDTSLGQGFDQLRENLHLLRAGQSI